MRPDGAGAVSGRPLVLAAESSLTVVDTGACGAEKPAVAVDCEVKKEVPCVRHTRALFTSYEVYRRLEAWGRDGSHR